MKKVVENGLSPQRHTAVLRWCYRSIFSPKPRSPGAEYKYIWKKNLVSKLSNAALIKGLFQALFKNGFHTAHLSNENESGNTTTPLLFPRLSSIHVTLSGALKILGMVRI